RRARRLLRPHVGPAARPDERRRDDRAGCRRPAAVRLSPGRRVRHEAGGPRAGRRDPRRAGRDVGPRVVRPRRDQGRGARRGGRLAGGPGGPEVRAGVCHHVAMSDDDLWRRKDSADEPDDQPADETSGAAGESRDLDMTQPITGGSGAAPSADAPPSPPPTPPGPSYDAPAGPGAVPPPTNPYGQPPGPYTAPYGGEQEPAQPPPA